jgi:hypothetical protein
LGGETGPAAAEVFDGGEFCGRGEPSWVQAGAVAGVVAAADSGLDDCGLPEPSAIARPGLEAAGRCGDEKRPVFRLGAGNFSFSNQFSTVGNPPDRKIRIFGLGSMGELMKSGSSCFTLVEGF